MPTIGQKKAARAAHKAGGGGTGRLNSSSFVKQLDGSYKSSMTGQTSPYKSVNTVGKYESSDGLKFNTHKEAADYNTSIGTNPSTKNQSTTTLSGDKSTDIANNNLKLDQYSEKGVQTNPESGLATDATGNVYEPQKEVVADTSEEDNSISRYYDQLTKSLDASTQAQVSGIKSQYDQMRADQIQANKSMEAQTQNSLLMGGVTGQGSSAQYAPISSVGIMQSQVSYGLRQISNLNFQENQLIAEAKQAQEDGKFRIVEKKLAMVEEKRKEKLDAAAKLNEQIAKANEKALEESLEQQKEEAVLDLYSQGLTDPVEIAQSLRDSGFSVPLKQISDTVALASGIGGTGIVGEYNFYKSDAIKRGQVPVSFNTYQDMDANRKKSIAKAGVATTGSSGATYSPAQEKVIVRVDKDIANNPTYKRTQSMIGYVSNVESALSQVSGVGDIAAINQFQKVIDEGAVTRDQDVKLIQSAQSLSNSLQTKLKRLQKGEQLSPELRSQMLKATQDILEAQKKAIGKDPFIKAKKNELERNKIDPLDSIFGELEGGNGAVDNIIEQGEQAKTSVDSFITTNPDSLEVETISKFYSAGKSDYAIYEWLKLKGLVQ